MNALQHDESLFTQSDYNRTLWLSKVSSYRDTTTVDWPTSLGQLIHLFYERPEFSSVKEGAGFLIGPCKDHRRNNASLMYSNVGVIDADSSLEPDGSVVSGAPPIDDVHEALVSFNLSHVIYSTYSHGSGKGNRYRILFPMTCLNKTELLAALSYIVEKLQTVAGINIALTKESHTWSQPWQLPKVSGPDAPYVCKFHYTGNEIIPRQAAIRLGLYDANGNIKKCTVPEPYAVFKQIGEDDEDTKPSIIKHFNRTISALDLLASHGYTFHSQSVIIGADGEASLSYRFKKPGSMSDPGVVAFTDLRYEMNQGGYNYSVYSHHSNDPLCNGHANDAFGCLLLLNGGSLQTTVVQATKMVQAEVNMYLSEQYPSIADRSFRVLNRCFAGSKVYYNAIDWNAFVMTTITQEPVPTIERSDTGDRYVKFVPVAEYWKTCKERITYADQIFAPYPADQDNGFHYEDNGTYKFNTFHGWAEKPRKGNWPLLQQHLYNAICGGNDREYEYLLDWFSHLFCRPHEKPGVAIVLRGGKGWGKSSVFTKIKQAIGYNATVLSHSEQLVGKFNSHIRDSLLIIAEEAFFHGNKKDASALKHLITDEESTVEQKGKDAKSYKSLCRIIMVTNEDLVVEATGDERRYFIPTLTDWSYQKDIVNGEKGHFFPQLFEEMDNGGVAAFMYDMLQRKATMRKVVNVPNTDGLEYQRVQALTGTQAWLYRALRNAHFETKDKVFHWTTNGLRVSEKDLLESIKPELSPHERGRNYVYSVMTQLRRALGVTFQAQSGAVVFSQIEKCRAEFLRKSLVPSDSFDDACQPLEVQGRGNLASISR